MILGLGTDITDCTRIDNLLKRRGDAFRLHLLTNAEAQEEDGLSYIAGRWWSDIATGEGTLFHLVPSPDETLDGYRIVKTSPEDPGNDLLYVQVNAGGDQYRVAGNGRYGDNFTDYAVCTWQFWTPEEHDEYITIKTHIDGIATPSHFPANIHTLTGTLVRSHAANAGGLPRGIYLIGGKKLLVK